MSLLEYICFHALGFFVFARGGGSCFNIFFQLTQSLAFGHRSIYSTISCISNIPICLVGSVISTTPLKPVSLTIYGKARILRWLLIKMASNWRKGNMLPGGTLNSGAESTKMRPLFSRSSWKFSKF